MLNLPDRQRKFEALRAHWESVDTRENITMVSRRMKPALHHGDHADLQQNAGSKFRRKLSNGLALISLTQRKNVSGRQASSNASLAVSAPSTNDSSTAILEQDAFLSPQADSTSLTSPSNPPLSPQDIARASEDVQTPRPLPRSRTFSYIPRPVKLDFEGSPAEEFERDESHETPLETIMTESKPRPPSRIPTASPPPSRRRVSSPRQCVPMKPPLQARIATNRQSSTGVANGSPVTAAVRSRTTPNLAKTNTPQLASLVPSRRPEPKRPFAPSTPQKPTLAENVPTSKRVAQRQSQIQERLVKRESLTVPSAAANRRSFGPGVPPVQNRRASFAPSVSSKRLSVQYTQTPVTAKRVTTKPSEGFDKLHSPRPSAETTFTHSQELDAEGSSTQTLSTLDLLDLPLAPPPKLRNDVVNDTANDVANEAQRKTLGTPNGLGGVWRSSKVFAAANHQVRRLPRSSTFHHFGRRSEAPPPVPPIPHLYNLPSFSGVSEYNTQHGASNSTSTFRIRFPMTSRKFGSSSRSLLSDIASTQRSKEAASIKSMSTSVSTTVSGIREDGNEESSTNEPETTYRFKHEYSATSIERELSRPGSPSKTSSDTTALLPMNAIPNLKPVGRSNSVSMPVDLTGNLQSHRSWSISERFYPSGADEDTCAQVKDYMPPLYWAGRFQSRFDQWRTEAMIAKLRPDLTPEDDGLLGQCSLDHEKKATILIFMQLRDLCASAQAADSLHEFEYRYRKDHKLLDTRLDLPPSLRKPDDSTAKGPIGRAVRKLTPRKASFVNLFKVKGWNRADDAKTAHVSGHVRELQDIADSSNGREDGVSDSYESTSQLHVRQLTCGVTS